MYLYFVSGSRVPSELLLVYDAMCNVFMRVTYFTRAFVEISFYCTYMTGKNYLTSFTLSWQSNLLSGHLAVSVL